ncbi:hypothetical protein [Mucilaginibacter antarcticus]
MLYFFGEPVYYSGRGLNQSGLYGCDDHVSGQLIFDSGVVVNGSWAFNVAESESIDECLIIGSKGSISFPFFGHSVTTRIEGIEDITDYPALEHVQQPMIEKVVSYFNGQGDNPCSIDEAATVMKIIDAFSKPV